MEEGHLELKETNPDFKIDQDSSDSESDDEDDEIEEVRIREEELAKLKKTLAEQEKIRKKAEKAEKKEERRLLLEKLEQEKAQLMSHSKLMMTKGVSALSSVSLVSPSLASQQQANDSSKNTASAALRKKAAEHAARQQQKAAERVDTENIGGLTMPGIRSIPGMTPQVEQLLSSLQSIVPSLARPPTTPTALGSSYQPPGVLGVQTTGQVSESDKDIDEEFVYVAKLGKLVKVVQPSPVRTSNEVRRLKPVSPPPLPVLDDEEASDDED